MHSDLPSVIIQVDANDAKGLSNVQHVLGDSRASTQLSDMAKDNSVDSKGEFAMGKDRPNERGHGGSQSLVETLQVRAKPPSVQENLGAVGGRHSSQQTLGGRMHSVSKEVPLIAHSRPSSMPAAPPLLEGTPSRVWDLHYTTRSTSCVSGQSMAFENRPSTAPASASMSFAPPTLHRAILKPPILLPPPLGSRVRGLPGPPFLGDPSMQHSSGWGFIHLSPRILLIHMQIVEAPTAFKGR